MTPHPVSHPDPARGAIEEKAVKTTLLCAMALGLSVTATAAAAQDSDSITIQSSVPKFCQSVAGLEAAPIALGSLSDGVGQLVDTFTGDTDVSLATYYCNGPATITLDAQPLVRTPAVPINDAASFTGQVDYLASLSWSDVAISNATTAGSATVYPTGAPKTGTLTVSVSSPTTQGNRRPVAGDYEGSVILNVNFN